MKHDTQVDAILFSYPKFLVCLYKELKYCVPVQSYNMHIQQKYLLSSVRSSGVKRKNCIKKHEMKNMAETRMLYK